MYNESRYVKRLGKPSLVRKILKAYGIETRLTPADSPNRKPGVWRPNADIRYVILVFDMNPIHLEHVHSGDIPIDPNLARRLGSFAVRAVYASGLDYALVTIARSGPKQLIVEQIDPFPSYDGDADHRLREAMQEKANQLRDNRQTIMLGMDPEFLLLNASGKIVPASRYLSYRGSAGHDAVSVRGRTGVHPLAELRPEPSADPRGLIRNLRKTMWIAARRINDPTLRWVAGGMPVPGLPLGGHIHFSGITLSGALVRALDNYVALPLLLAENERTRKRRARYGRLGDVREKTHGGFEYRTLPSVLVSPLLTKGTIALAKLVATHYDRLRQRPLDQLDYLQAYMIGDKEKLSGVIHDLIADIERLPERHLFSSYLNPLYSLIYKRVNWDESRDFRIAWRIPPFQ